LSGQTSLFTLAIDDGLKKNGEDIASSQKYIHALSYAPNGLYGASGNIDGLVSIYDMKKREAKAKLENHGMAVRALTFDLAGQSILSSGEDLHTFVTDVETLKRKQTLVGHSGWVSQIAMHPTNHSMFITGSLDSTVKVWSTSSHKEVSTIHLGSPVWGVAYSPSGEYLAAATENGTISLINCKI
jgi:WD40 repeat protein